MSRRINVRGVLGWLLIAGLGTLVLVMGTRTALRERFDVDARILHRVLSQRLEQQEAVLFALDALSQQGVASPTLERYAARLLSSYPQVVALEQCRPQGCRALTPGGLELPALPGIQPQRPTLLWPPGGGVRYALALHRVRVWVDAGRLLASVEQPQVPLSVQIVRPETGEVLVQAAELFRSSALTFSVDKVLGTSLQPFPIRFERTLPWTVWPWGQVAAWWALSGVLALWVTRLRRARQRADQAVQDERRRAEGIVQASSDGIVALDLLGRVVQRNPAAQRILGELPVGTGIRRAATFQATLKQASFGPEEFWNSPQAVSLPEGTALRRGTETVLVEGTLTPLLDAAGRLSGRVLTVREVGPLRQRLLAQLTEGERRLREHEAHLAHVSRLSTLGEMGAGLAHELNQPLTAIVSYGQAGIRLLDGGEDDLLRARQALEAMVAQAHRAGEIITRLRSLARRAPTVRGQVDLAQSAQNILALCRADLTRQDTEVQTDFPARPALARADAVQVEQILLNLIRNALEAMEHRTPRRLTMTLRPCGQSWVLSVQDSGSGLSPDALRRLFTPFNTAKLDGLGLGLTLSQTLAQGMDGELTGENVPGGARFTLTLPLWREVYADAF